MRITRAVVPTLFTVLNMFCGLLSIVQASDGNFIEAIYFIILAGVFDALDGMMARLTKSSSQFGVEIDSLSDIVSFGAAPAFLAYKVQLYQLNEWGMIISSLLMIMGGIRLARFNVQLVGFDKDYFTGLPIPASAFAIVSYLFTFMNDAHQLEGIPALMLAPLSVALSLIMVSKIKYDTLPKFSAKEVRKHPVKSISFFFCVLLIVVTKGEALFYVFAAFVLFGVGRYLYRAAVPSAHHEQKEIDQEEAPSYDI
ncbi:MAG: CDP-diacylglycerol--serine O-phosphatidyltransferase [Bacteriovoracaceae bacterium]|nr:CDP-diacylglycerol--serine O-phosphatidyltransferase [Bacteroidota bacterium]